MPTILIVTPSERQRDLLATSLRQADFAIAWLSEPSTLATAAEGTPDLLLLDGTSLSAPQLQEALSQARNLHLPCLALLPEAALEGYRFVEGADDFLVHPARPAELVARVRQLLWRLRGSQGDRVVRVGDLVIDQEQYEVAVAGRRIALTFKEYELLRLLASSPGRVFTREELLSRVWGYDYFGGTRTVDVHIRRLRSKIEDAHHTFIETVWNVGYRLKPPA